MNLSGALFKLSGDGAPSDQVELSLKSRRGRILHLFSGQTAPYLPLADVTKDSHPALTAVENLFRHGGYKLPQDALKFEGTRERDGRKIHRYSAHAKAGRQTGKPLSELLWLATR